jgi:ATP-dependent helicase HrpB
VRVTRDVADQRAGRSGRLGPGVCYRLWANNVQATLKSARVPEILEADLAPLLLELYQWGVRNVSELDWITPPPAAAVAQGMKLLHDLGAIEGEQITARGRKMVKLPTHPRIAHMIVIAQEANNEQVLALATDLAALLEERDPLPKEAGSDVSLRLDALRRWRAGERVNADRFVLERIERLAAAWRRLLKTNVDNARVLDSMIGKLLMEAYPERIARQVEKQGERYKLMNNRMAKLAANDPLSREPWLAIAELDAGAGEAKIFLTASLDERDLELHAALEENVYWDDTREMIVGVQEKKVGILVLNTKPLPKLPDHLKIATWLKIIRERGLRFLSWDDALTEWQARILSLKRWRTDENWPDVSDEALIESLDEWLSPFLTSIYKKSELDKLDPHAILSTVLPWDLQNRLDALVPVRISVPSGSSIKLQYSRDGAAPILEVRLQEVFGLTETPTVNEGRTKVIMHLLSPGYKPVQVTQDLRSFWTTTYNEVRKELRMRYPKHSWPEDPWTAEAVRGAKKRQ